MQELSLIHIYQYTMRKFVLASLRINLHQLHLDLVAFLDARLFNLSLIHISKARVFIVR